MDSLPPNIVELALFLLIAYVLGCAIGYALKRMVSPQTHGAQTNIFEHGGVGESVPVANESEREPVAEALQADAVVKTADSEAAPPVEPQKQDLKKIKGIGPKIEAKLNALEIVCYAQIASWTTSDIAEMNEKLSFKGRIEREEWVKQAKGLIAS